MWLEEAHNRRYEVPGEVDGGKEANRLDCDAVGEQHSKGMKQSRVLALCFGCLTTGFPFARLIETAL